MPGQQTQGLTEFDCHCFPISAHRAFIGALVITDLICWFDARQKQLQSATRTTTSGNRRQRGRIKAIWLRHGAPPDWYRRERDYLSVTDACGRALAGDDLSVGRFLVSVGLLSHSTWHIAAHLCSTFCQHFLCLLT